MTDQRRFSIKEIRQMAADLTIKSPQTLDKIHNAALDKLVERAILLGKQEVLEEELAKNNVVDIHKNRGKKK